MCSMTAGAGPDCGCGLPAEIEKIRRDALFLKHVVVCGGSGPAVWI